ncbi:CBS domain-containing protein [Kitasatospora sp. NPDC006697]|uniref:CBS domain-containing protein n=1 Tax=Kitasatospora sp. NPDC006697 TaxID=3364020 RepID=UPI0036997064
MTVRDLMTYQPVTVAGRTSLTDVARRMRENDIGDVLVAEDGRLTGILTDRDLVVRAMADGGDPDRLCADDICSTEPVSVAPGDEVDHAIDLMRSLSVRRIPVVEDGRPVGILSLGDLAIERDRGSALAEISAAASTS